MSMTEQQLRAIRGIVSREDNPEQPVTRLTPEQIAEVHILVTGLLASLCNDNYDALRAGAQRAADLRKAREGH